MPKVCCTAPSTGPGLRHSVSSMVMYHRIQQVGHCSRAIFPNHETLSTVSALRLLMVQSCKVWLIFPCSFSGMALVHCCTLGQKLTAFWLSAKGKGMCVWGGGGGGLYVRVLFVSCQTDVNCSLHSHFGRSGPHNLHGTCAVP